MNRYAVHLRDQMNELLRAAEFEQLMAICKPALMDARSRQDTEGEAMALIAWAQAHYYLGKFSEARILVDGALRFAREADAPDLEILALNTSAALHLIGAFQSHEAEQDYRLALAIAHESNEREMLSASLAGVAAALLAQEDSTRATRFAREAFEVARDIENPDLIAIALAILGNTSLSNANHEQAIKSYQDALELVQKHGIRLIEGELMANLGTALAHTERYQSEGLQMIERAHQIAIDLNSIPQQYHALLRLGVAYQSQKQVDLAKETFESLLQEAQTWQIRAYECGAFFQLGIFAYANAHFDEALANFEQALIISKETLNPYREAQIELMIARTYRHQHRYEEVLAHQMSALGIYESLSDGDNAMRTLQSIALTRVQSWIDKILRFFGLRKASTEPHED